jgi:hypothetical protein
LAIGASGCPLAAMATQYCNPLVIVEIGGVFSHSSTASAVVDTESKVSRLLKYLLHEDDSEAYRISELRIDDKSTYDHLLQQTCSQLEPPAYTSSSIHFREYLQL